MQNPTWKTSKITGFEGFYGFFDLKNVKNDFVQKSSKITPLSQPLMVQLRIAIFKAYKVKKLDRNMFFNDFLRFPDFTETLIIDSNFGTKYSLIKEDPPLASLF